MINKVYAHKCFETNDKSLIEISNVLDSLSSNADKNDYHKLSKIVSNMIRENLKTECMVGLAIHKDKTSVLINLYDIKATDDNFFDQHFDNEKNQFYLTIGKG